MDASASEQGASAFEQPPLATADRH
jgi:hypothetical protein